MALYELDGERPRTPANGRYWVAETAVLVGKIVLEEDANVWFGTVMRGDNETITVGARSNVQDGCILHTDPGFPLDIGPDCTVGHGAILHGCAIGAGSLIGMGATVLNGAKIGKSCLVGANALVTEGKEFPDFSMIVGSPAKVVKTLGPEWEIKLLGTSGRYVANARRFAKGMKRVD
ncbi:carbonic anhydrase/acetyltransferase-like protein (isoleucine patch superfamily) [Methylopila capsulata]|uniref:Carbonic anhydrase/acetyltransferase-like protein (Isoleucine patch superfamily) n=1 Tax=Methylopila capsulata TaxID=61654 RepID=A0A9W6MTQ1_9HYPH|nr:gamma carbonic anhydrase family protein [Methylopila capsulata]MBM7853232.1 carbonic anhydrase/acetyltransferase-like protein (isoleucine patch superfamily) [Methylopila capsulata]GLK57554.1 gamma carbonic anhydrase family protein [Methylopila capsulata]